MYKTEIQRSKSVAEKTQNDAKGCKMFKDVKSERY